MRIRRRSSQPILAAASLAWLAGTARADPPRELDLATAIATARQNSPVLSAAQLRIREAQGDLTGASILLINNPELSAFAGPRSTSGQSSSWSVDVDIGLEQRFEIGGQRGHRIDGARASERASEASADDVRRVVDLAVALTFSEALAAERRLQVLEESERLARSLFDATRVRLERGEGTPLEVNTARIRHAEVQRRLSSARAVRRATVIRLSELLGLSPGTGLGLRGDLPDTALAQPEDRLVAQALDTRPDLRAATNEVEATDAAVKLADSRAWPDVSLGLVYSRDEQDNVILGGLRIPLPLFNRNQGERERSRATAARARAEKLTRQLAVESEVRTVYAEYEQARDALQLYDAEVLRAQEESLQLLQRAFEAGQVSYADVIVVQREVLESRDGYLDARLGYARARARVLAASDLPQLAAAQGGAP